MDAQSVVNGKQARGMTMVIALVVVAVLLFVAVVLLSSAFGSAAAENSIRAKLAAFNAAQAGIDQVVNALDDARGRATDCVNGGSNSVTSGTLADGGTYEWCIAWNSIVSGPSTVPDHANVNNKINVPSNTVYAWSSGLGDDGGRGVLIEALIAPSTGMDLPSGAILAGGDVYVRGDVGVYASAPGADNATIRANGSIYQSGQDVVQGPTYAVGVDQVNGSGGNYPNSAPMTVPTQSQITADAGDASNEARSGMNTIPAPSHSTVIEGNALVNGDLDLSSGTIVFEQGRSVFIDGNVCLTGNGRIVNEGANVWVSGTMSTVGSTGGYASRGAGGTLVVLGTDSSPQCANSLGNYALQFDPTSAVRVGLVYAPNGSIDLSGPGIIGGAIAAGANVYLDSTSGGGIRYDRSVAPLLPTYDFKIVSYMEY